MELNLKVIKAIKTIVNAMAADGDVWVRISDLGGVEVAKSHGSIDNITPIAQDVKMVELLAEETIDKDNSLAMGPYDPPGRNPDLPTDW